MRTPDGIWLVSEQRIGQKSPGPLWLGSDEAVASFLCRLRADGFDLFPTSGNRALLRAPGGLIERFVWLETARGRALPIARFL